jgi:hypothetical protein
MTIETILGELVSGGIDVRTLLLAGGIFVLALTAGFVWCVHKGWLSV